MNFYHCVERKIYKDVSNINEKYAEINKNECNRKQKLFVDMDGVIAEFKPVDTLETLYEENYFLNLKPEFCVISAIKDEIAARTYDVYILSSYLSDSVTALDEKNQWLDRYLPEIPVEKRLFPPCGVSKRTWLEQNGFDIEGAVLLDDYSKNLHEWDPPGKGLKFFNGINGTKGTWRGSSSTSADIKESLSIILSDCARKHKIKRKTR